MRRLVTSIFIVASIFVASSTSAQQSEKRIALVIGNAAYQGEALPTAANDAGLIAQTHVWMFSSCFLPVLKKNL